MMDPSEAVGSTAFSEEDKLPEGIDEDANWFGKNLADESDNTEHEVLNAQLNQDELGVDLDTVKDSDVEDKGGEKSVDMDTDSQSELLDEISGKSVTHQKDELAELSNITIDTKKHDISNELKEMFEEKSSDAEEMHETSMTKHSLDTEEITKEDKLKDIVPDDILGKDDSFDGLDNDALHQELEAHLTYEKNKELIASLPDTNTELHHDVSQDAENADEESQSQMQTEPNVDKSIDDLSFEGKTELLKNLAENMETKDIDEIMGQSIPSEGENSKDLASDLKKISSDLEVSESELQNVISEQSEQSQIEQEQRETMNQVDKSNIELNQENMMVEFAHSDGNQVLIQINTDHNEMPVEEPPKSDALVMETADGQTLVFSTETMETSSADNEIESQVEGGAAFLHAVTGKLEDVLMPVKSEPVKETTNLPTTPSTSVVQALPTTPASTTKIVVKEESPKCCISTCKSGKSSLKTTFRYFKPPVNKLLYKKWEFIFNQAKQQISPDSLICELHFRTGLIYKRGMDRTGKILWALRDGALPKLSPSGVLRVTGPIVPSPSTTVQVTKKPDGAVKTPTTLRPIAPAPHPELVTKAVTITTPTKTAPKKILQKPVKTVATKVSNEVTDIGFLYKNPELVKVAQEELLNQDVLVCGECHSVFHILELFQAHKMANNCKGESNFKGNPSEPKPQVWAFLLWKSAQAKVSDVDSSWKLYQRWCKMDERIRESWVAAGKSLQESNAIAAIKMVDTTPPKGKVGRPPLRDKDSEDEDYASRSAKKPKTKAAPVVVHSAPEEIDLGGAGDAAPFSEPEPMEVEASQVSPAKPTEDANDVDETLENLSRHTPELITSEVEIKQEVISDDESGENKENDVNSRKPKTTDEVQNCSRCKLPISDPKKSIFCAAGCYGYFHVECTRVMTPRNLSKLGAKKLTWKCDTCKIENPTAPVKAKPPLSRPVSVPEKPKGSLDKEEEEFVVEKIVSRRYNIKKKHFEYLLKWEGYPSEQNTWEPAENLGTCQHLLKAFEEALAKQQAAKQLAAARQGGAKPVKEDSIRPPIMPRKKAEPSTPGPSTPLISTGSTGRPGRASKQKAMDQVKQWCGSIVKQEPVDDVTVGQKRRASSDSEYEEEVVVKRVKVEVESEESDSGSMNRFFSTPASRGRRKPLGSTTPAKAASTAPVVNGDGSDFNLAAELGLESDEEGAKVPATPSPQKSPQVVRKMSSLSPHNQQVLVASAKGVVKVDPKQVPSLSSGVYIMSNKSGIVRVDNDRTLNTLQKSGVLKKSDLSNLPSSVESSTGVVVLPKAEPNTPQQKAGIVRKVPVTSPSATTTTTPRPSGVLKPVGTPRPSGVLKAGGTPTTPNTPRPLGIPPGVNTKIQQVVQPRGTAPLRGRPVANTVLKGPSPNLQASTQHKLLIAKKKSESESDGALLPKMEPSIDIKSTNRVLAHPLLGRGRGRGYRGRGRGGSLSQLMQMSQRTPEPEAVKESRLVDSDNLLMEFQEPSDSEESDEGVDDGFPSLEDLPPVEPDSPPRPLTLCPLTGKVLCKAEGEKTPEPTPPPSPKAPTPPPEPPKPDPEPSHILPDHEDEVEVLPPPVSEVPPVPPAKPLTTQVTVPPVQRAVQPAPAPAPTTSTTTTTTLVKHDGMICKVEMSPGGTTGTLVETMTEAEAATAGVTEGTVTIKKPRSRANRGPQLSVLPSNSSSSSLGTITVPARKLFQEETGEDDMVTITGEDGLVYQVSNSELTGNTLLVSSGEDGQQCVYVTTDGDGTEEGSTILTLDTAYADAVAQLGTDQVNILQSENGDQFYIKEGDGDEEGQLMALEGGEEMMGGDDSGGQVVAQLVEAGEPAPGGSRRVVLLLPDGNLMMTEVDEEQYAALDLDK